MPEESRRTFLLRYAAMALAALAPSGARAAGDDGGAAKPLGDPGSLTKDVYGPPPSPYPTLHPRRPPPPAPALRPAAEPLSDPRSPAAAAARRPLRPAAEEPARLDCVIQGGAARRNPRVAGANRRGRRNSPWIS